MGALIHLAILHHQRTIHKPRSNIRAQRDTSTRSSQENRDNPSRSTDVCHREHTSEEVGGGDDEDVGYLENGRVHRRNLVYARPTAGSSTVLQRSAT